jgi:hypothetical protein
MLIGQVGDILIYSIGPLPGAVCMGYIYLRVSKQLPKLAFNLSDRCLATNPEQVDLIFT